MPNGSPETCGELVVFGASLADQTTSDKIGSLTVVAN